MEPEGLGRRLAAIMFTDIVGYTALMAESEAKGHRVRERQAAILRPVVEQYGGDWVQHVGDETLSSFASATDAVNCALSIQAALQDEPELRVRVGIHLGEIVSRDGSVHGDGVNIASRIRPLAEPGGICVSDEVQHAIRNQENIETVPLGERPDARGDVHPVAVDAAFARDDLAHVDADADAKLRLVAQGGLDRERAVHRIHCTREAREGLVPDVLDPVAAVLLDQRTQHLPLPLAHAVARLLALRHQGRVADDVGEHDRGQPSARALRLHAGPPPPDPGVPPLPRSASAYPVGAVDWSGWTLRRGAERRTPVARPAGLEPAT